MKPKQVLNEKTFFNVSSQANIELVRKENLEDEEHLVVSVVMLVEGVLNRILYTKEELNMTPSAWNYKPSVINHPESVTATTESYLNSNGVGKVMNTEVDLKGNNGLARLKAELWIKESRLNKISPNVLERINKREMIEVSTGLWLQLEPTRGEFNGKEYDGIARNLVPDHLAILPDSIGASSVEDGAGLVRNEDENAKDMKIRFSYQANEMSSESIRDAIRQLLREKLDTSDDKYVWVEAIYADSNFVIYEYDGKSYKQSYSDENDGVKLDGEPMEVVRIIEYRTKDGSFVGNNLLTNKAEDSAKTKKEEIKNMEKSKIVDALIKNEKLGFNIDDKDSLMAADEKILNALNAEPEVIEKEVPKEVEVLKKITNREELEEAIDDEELKAVVVNSVKQYDKEHSELVKQILAVENCPFDEDELKAKPLEKLKAINKFAVKQNNYAGQIEVPNITGRSVDDVQNKDGVPSFPKFKQD